VQVVVRLEAPQVGQRRQLLAQLVPAAAAAAAAGLQQCEGCQARERAGQLHGRLCRDAGLQAEAAQAAQLAADVLHAAAGAVDAAALQLEAGEAGQGRQGRQLRPPQRVLLVLQLQVPEPAALLAHAAAAEQAVSSAASEVEGGELGQGVRKRADVAGRPVSGPGLEVLQEDEARDDVAQVGGLERVCVAAP
jgi:hypothetical protein